MTRSRGPPLGSKSCHPRTQGAYPRTRSMTHYVPSGTSSHSPGSPSSPTSTQDLGPFETASHYLSLSNMAQARLEVLANQISEGLSLSHTSALTIPEDPDCYTVSLPEKLTSDGRWDMPFLGTRKRDDKGKLGSYQWMTYSQVGDARTSIGSGLLELGVNPKCSMGIYASNCREWVIVDGAMHAYSIVSVPLYDTLGPDVVEYISNHAELVAVACAAPMLDTVLQELPKCPTVKLVLMLDTMLQVLPKCPTVKLVVVFGHIGRLPEPPFGCDARIISLEQSLGRRHPKAHVAPKPSDLATVCYTSGTTGAPKGAMLTHSNMIASSAGTSVVLNLGEAGWKYISYLPLAHIYERTNLVSMAHLGNAVGFYNGDVQELLDDVLTLKPEIFPSVPRLWNRIYDRSRGAHAV
eukprot:gene31766-6963_t